ncbi:MAG TPA: hypothetical protein VM324_14515 [Egibacteraceae bacterium]|nr:hypothetical protein [Egibacteraceae bacterium]
MRAITPNSDERHAAFCAQCGGLPRTRDHVPPKAFLDEPFPTNLPVVGTCGPCNSSASVDEEYVACLIEVAACGSAVPEDLERPRVRRALGRSAALAARFRAALDPEAVTVEAEAGRVRRVVEKMARGLWAYELAEPALGMSARVGFRPLHTMDGSTRNAFEHSPPPAVFAEVGSRMITRQALGLCEGNVGAALGWLLVQPNRFRYAVEFDERSIVKLVLREYLAVEVRFTER